MPQSIITKVLKASTPVLDFNTRLYGQRARDVMTGATTTALVLSNSMIDGTELLFKNGVLLTPTTAYTVDKNGMGITLAVAAIAGDVFVAIYQFRSAIRT